MVGGVTHHMLPHLPGVPHPLCKHALNADSFQGLLGSRTNGVWLGILEFFFRVRQKKENIKRRQKAGGELVYSTKQKITQLKLHFCFVKLFPNPRYVPNKRVIIISFAALSLQVSSWQKFWVGLCGNWLHFFLPKHRTFGRRDRAAVSCT